MLPMLCYHMPSFFLIASGPEADVGGLAGLWMPAFHFSFGQEVSGFSLCSDIGEFIREGDSGCSCKDENFVFEN